jgi:putative peptidoglycan lipid II flippase
LVTGKSAVKSISIIIIIGLISRIFGFVRELVVANYFGTSREMDAYNIAFNVPGILLAGLSAAITIIFIPTFTEKLERSDKESAFELSRKIFSAFALLGVIISILGIIFATQITHLLAPSFSRDQLVLTVGLTRVLLLSGVFTLLIGLCTGLLQAQENFAIPALLGFPLSICIIGSVVLWSRSFGITLWHSEQSFPSSLRFFLWFPVF